MLFFSFWVLVWLLFFIGLLLVVRFINHCFHVVVVYFAAGNKFSIKFAGKIFKPTT